MLDHENTPEGLTAWLASSQTGASAKSIVAHLTGHGEQDGAYPHDADDFARCERLLGMVPSLRPDLPRMAEVNAYWAAIVPRWDEIKRSINQTALIKEITGPIEKADPGHIPFGENASIRFGGNDFQGDEFEAGAAEARSKMEEKARKGRAPMKEDPDFREHNDASYRVTAAELRQFIERFERLEAEKKDIADQQKEVMAEAEGRGYDTKVMRKVIALRKRDKDDIAEEEAVLEMYKEALGM